MACFIVPAAEAAVLTLVMRAEKRKNRQIDYIGRSQDENGMKGGEQEEPGKCIVENEGGAKLAGRGVLFHKMRWLTNLLWGGSAILAFEHLWHGEIVPYFPFLTAMYSAQDTAEMLREMASVGGTMALLVTAVWLGMVKISDVFERREQQTDAKEGRGERI